MTLPYNNVISNVIMIPLDHHTEIQYPCVLIFKISRKPTLNYVVLLIDKTSLDCQQTPKNLPVNLQQL